MQPKPFRVFYQHPEHGDVKTVELMAENASVAMAMYVCEREQGYRPYAAQQIHINYTGEAP